MVQLLVVALAQVLVLQVLLLVVYLPLPQHLTHKPLATYNLVKLSLELA
jgi:hypothetical protein